ncbi:MAG: hypothetical protein ACT4O1_08525, partial [Gemmatimonadota bacterium]
CSPERHQLAEPAPQTLVNALKQVQSQNLTVLVVDSSGTKVQGRVRDVTAHSVTIAQNTVALGSIESVYRRAARMSSGARRGAILGGLGGAALGAFLATIRSSDGDCDCGIRYVGGGAFMGGLTGLLFGSVMSGAEGGWQIVWRDQ